MPFHSKAKCHLSDQLRLPRLGQRSIKIRILSSHDTLNQEVGCIEYKWFMDVWAMIWILKRDVDSSSDIIKIQSQQGMFWNKIHPNPIDKVQQYLVSLALLTYLLDSLYYDIVSENVQTMGIQRDGFIMATSGI